MEEGNAPGYPLRIGRCGELEPVKTAGDKGEEYCTGNGHVCCLFVRVKDNYDQYNCV